MPNGPNLPPTVVLPPVVVPPPSLPPVGLSYQDQEAFWHRECPGCAKRANPGACRESMADLFARHLFFAADPSGLPYVVTPYTRDKWLQLDPWYCDPVWAPQLTGTPILRDTFSLPLGWRADGISIQNLPTPPPVMVPGTQPGQNPYPGVGQPPRPGGDGVTFGDIVSKGITVAEALGLVKGLGGKEDFAGVVAALLGILSGEGEIARSLQQVAPAFGEKLGLHLGALGTAFQQAQEVVARATTQAAETQGSTLGGAVERLGSGIVASIVEAVRPIFQRVVEFLKDLVKEADRLTTDASQELVSRMLSVFERTLVDQLPITPGTVPRAAGAALRDALVAGLGAQLTALGIELLHPLKNMGASQIAGLVAQFAGFGEIIGPATSPTLRYALTLPAQYRAANLFRTQLLDPRTAQEQAAARHIPVSDYAKVLAMNGYPPEIVQVLVDDVYTDPRTMELARMSEGAELEPAWVALKLRELGWEDADVAMGTRSLILKASQPGRQYLVTQAAAEYVDGHLDREDFLVTLDAAGLAPTHREYFRRGAELRRRGDMMERAGKAILGQYEARLLEPRDAAEQLAGVGFVPEEVRSRLLEADYKRRLQQVREVKAEQRAEVAHIRSTTLASLKAQLKARQINRATFELWGEALGYSPAYVGVVADTVLLGPPAAKADQLPLVGLGAVEASAAAVAPHLVTQVGLGRIPAAWAVAELHSLGLPADLAKAVIDVAQVLGLKVPGSLNLPLPFELAGRLTWEALAAEAIQLIRRGRGGTRFLEEALQGLGIDPGWAGDTASILRTLERLFLKRRP